MRDFVSCMKVFSLDLKGLFLVLLGSLLFLVMVVVLVGINPNILFKVGYGEANVE